jgi:hypothetical protein
MQTPRKTDRQPLYTVTAPCGVGFETPEGGFFVPTLFVESAFERARQEFASDRPVISAALFEGGRITEIVDWRTFDPHWDDQWSDDQ